MVQPFYRRRRIWTHQPQQAAQIDRSNPITQDLSFTLDRGRDAVSGKLATLNGQTLNASKNGIGLTSTTGAAATFGTGLFATSNGAGTGDFSFAVFANPSASATRTIVLGAIWGANPEPYFTFNGNGLDSNSSGRIAFSWNGSPRSYIESQSTSIVDGKWHLFSATRVNGVMFLVVDGVEVANNKALTSANLYKDTAITSIGGYSSSGYGLNGACVPFLAVANRAWSIGEHKSLFDNPWQIFRSADSRIWLPSAGGGTSDALTASNINGSSTVGSPAIAQAHSLSVGAIIASSVVSAPSVTQKHAITASAIVASATVASPAITQKHALTAAAISASSTVGATTLTEIVSGVLSALPVAATPAVVGAPSLTQNHALSTGAISAGPATFGTPTIAQQHALMAQGITAGAAVVGIPALTSGTFSGSLSDSDIARIASAVLAALQASVIPVNVKQVNDVPTPAPWPTATETANEVLNGVSY